jgi:hypothetical protein
MWLLFILICFIGSIIFHSIIVRLIENINRVISYVIVSLSFGIMLIVFLLTYYGINSIKTYAAISLFLLLVEIYVFLFTFTLSSISANILVSVRKTALTKDAISKIYDSTTMVNYRLERLKKNGFLESGNGIDNIKYYRITDKGYKFVRALGMMKKFFNHKLC